MSSLAAGSADLSPYVRDAEDGLSRMEAMVEGIHCAGCAQRIERALAERPEVQAARVNVTARKLSVSWTGGPAAAPALVAAVEALGFRVMPFDPDLLDGAAAVREKALLRAMAVAGFAAGNIMLLSVSVWAGHFQDMGPATRDLMHGVSALIALPAVAYAGRPFFASALSALRSRALNMDVPISLAVLLTTGMSLVETLRGAEHAYFDSATALLFFLLVGRFLDARARGRARSAAERLLALRAASVRIVDPDGSARSVPPQAVRAGDTLLIAAGERVPVDGRVVEGESDVDAALISGESVPAWVAPGVRVFAGTVNLTGPLRLTVEAVGEGTLLAEIARLMESAEQRRARHVAL
ncbi:MAG: heavy metal translocating P-type ATPase, partial [Acetobacterales bacterium]